MTGEAAVMCSDCGQPVQGGYRVRDRVYCKEDCVIRNIEETELTSEIIGVLDESGNVLYMTSWE